MKTLVNPILENDSKDGWPVKVDLKVIAPGLVHYEDLKDQSGNKVGGNVLIRKEAFDKMAASCEGKPIVNWDHRKVDPKEFSRGTFQGVVTGPAIFNAADGWYHAPGLVWDKATLANIEAGYSISCAYMPTEMDETGGKYNAVPYMAEVMDGRYTHIAVVSSPRYNEARIELLNSQGGSMNLLAKLFGKGFENGADIDVEKSTVKMEDGTERPLSELINSFKKAEALKAATEVLQTAPDCRAHVKRMLNQQYAAIDYETMFVSLMSETSEAREGMTAFMEKRQPNWIPEGLPG